MSYAGFNAAKHSFSVQKVLAEGPCFEQSTISTHNLTMAMLPVAGVCRVSVSRSTLELCKSLSSCFQLMREAIGCNGFQAESMHNSFERELFWHWNAILG